MKRRDDRNQTQFDWSKPQAPPTPPASGYPDPNRLVRDAPEPLVQRLPWDFGTTFPQPTDEAIDAGIVYETDAEPENLKSLHDDYCLQCLATLKQLNDVLDARRRNVDPKTRKAPKTHAARERLRKFFADEPARLEHTYRILIETYESAFGSGPADAFDMFVRATHAGIPVQAATPTRSPSSRLSSSFPVPRPLNSAVASGVFGRDQQGKPIRPATAEVRAITEQHAERILDLIETLDSVRCRPSMKEATDQAAGALKAALDAYAEDFGEAAAKQLARYARAQLRKAERGR